MVKLDMAMTIFNPCPEAWKIPDAPEEREMSSVLQTKILIDCNIVPYSQYHWGSSLGIIKLLCLCLLYFVMSQKTGQLCYLKTWIHPPSLDRAALTRLWSRSYYKVFTNKFCICGLLCSRLRHKSSLNNCSHMREPFLASSGWRFFPYCQNTGFLKYSHHSGEDRQRRVEKSERDGSTERTHVEGMANKHFSGKLWLQTLNGFLFTICAIEFRGSENVFVICMNKEALIAI